MVSMDSCCALPINEQVFTTITSASSALGVSSAPAWASMPIITSLSTRFLGQPRLTKPTLAGATGPEVADVIFSMGTGTMTTKTKTIGRKPIQTILASGMAISAPAGGLNPGHHRGYLTVLGRFWRPVLILWKQKLHPSTLPEERCPLNVSRF